MLEAFWRDAHYGSGATLFAGDTALGSIEYAKGGYVGRGLFGSWQEPEEDREHAKNLVAESTRALLSSQLKGLNKLLGHEKPSPK